MFRLSKFNCFAFLLAFLALSYEARSLELEPLIEPDDLNQILGYESLKIIDIRGEQYLEGHITGAIWSPYFTWRGPQENPGALLNTSQLTQVVRKAGITLEDSLVIVYQGNNSTEFGSAARVYWTLKSIGIKSISILNGGIKAWSDEAFSLTRDVTSVVPSYLNIEFNNQWLSTSDDVKDIVYGSTSGLLLDARPKTFYMGKKQHPSASTPGTLPNAVLFPHYSWFKNGNGNIMQQVPAKEYFQKSEIFETHGKVISFCNTGHWAATNWFALSELANVEGVTLYPESMVGWSNKDLEMMNKPGVWEKITDLFSSDD